MKNARLLGKGATLFTYLMVVMLSSIATRLNAQAPTANFNANVVSGCSPLIVNFSDQSTGNPTSWLWDLGNGSTSAVKNPTATYTTPGTYNITLTVTNANGSNTVTKTGYITVYVAPTAKFTSTDTAGCTPHNVVFTDQSTTPGGTISQWEWNFGDGGTSNSQNPAHTYSMAGTFNVFLKITNSLGCSQTIFKQQYIRTGSGAVANFIANIPNHCQAPVTVSFTNNTQASGAVTYSWDFGDGVTSSVQNPSHTYNTIGTYEVVLRVASQDGCTSIKRQTIDLSGKDVSFTGPETVCVGSAASFIMTSSPSPVSQTWNMGDGTTYTTASVNHTFTTPGTYNVILTNEFGGGCTTSKTQQVTVTSGPAIDFKADTTRACKTPFTVNFESIGGAGTYLWDFGDSTTSTEQNPTHVYQSSGVFTVKLSATSSAGCISSVEKAEFIIIKPPVAAISNVPVNDGCTPYSFSPQPNIDAADDVVSYLWDFGNGNTSTLEKSLHTYTTPGSYTIKLRIQTTGGCVDSITYPNAVNISTGKDIDFSAAPTTVCIDMPVNLTMNVPGGADSYMWEFGDGESSTDLSPSHNYKSAKKYSVTLNVKYGNCTSKLTKGDYITVSPPEAKFSASRDCNNKRLINFVNESIGTGNMLWSFGDGNSSSDQNPSHTYQADGSYTVSLTIDNGTCSHTFTQAVEVSSAPIDFSASKTTLCKGEQFTLKGAIPNTFNPVQYQWQVVNSGASNTTVDSILWAVYGAGTFDVILTAISQIGCVESVTKSSYLTVYGPTADFTTDKVGGCLNTNVAFTDSSLSDGTHPITQWIWDFGDGSPTQSGTAASHTFSAAGNYNVSLTVTDTYGCVDTRVKNSFINITNGKASFASIDSMSCRGRNVVFSDSSSGSISSWEWNFGDGNAVIGIQNPAHIYADSGVYTVKLKIIETSGCTDSITRTNYVTIKDPKAKFALSDTFSTCPPLTVSFTDQSYYADKWSWDFGDGGGSPIPSPINLYNIPNNYRVKLTVTSPGGCTDSAFASIRILGPYGNFTYNPLSGCTPLPVNYSVTSTEAVKFLWDFSDGIVDSGTVATASHVYLTGGRFVPKVILTDVSGCRVPVIGKDTIYIEKTNIEFEASAVAFCDRGTVVFSNTSIATGSVAAYQWDFGDGTFSTDKDPTHTYSSPGWYDVTLTSVTSQGCRDTLTKQAYIKINNSPVANITSPDSLCLPANFVFTAQLQPDTSGIKTWQWTFGNGQTSDVENPPAQSFTTEGSYNNTLFIEDNQGCSTTVSKTVVVHPLPILQISENAIICKGNSTQLSVSGAITYAWTPANDLSCTTCTDPVATPAFDTWYKVEGQSVYGCSSFDSVQVKVFQPYKISIDMPKDSLCLGRGITIKALGAPLYTWSPADGLSSTSVANPFASPQTTTTYKVVGYDSLGCFRDSAEVTLRVNPVPTVDAGPDIVVSAGSTANIQANASADATSFTWSPTMGLSSSTVLNPTIIAGSDMTYAIRVMNEFGCTAQDQVKVIVACTEGNLFVPNTFTPNGDGMNDVFFIRGKGIYAVKSLRIYNRWGEMVFQKKDVTPNDPNSGWNGMYKGTLASTDTYVYQLEVLCTNSQVLKYNGTISLIR